MKKLKLFVILSMIIGALFAFSACGTRTLKAPMGFDINEDDVLTWTEVADAKNYIIEIYDVANQKTKEEKERDEKIDLSDLDEGDYVIKIKAVGDGKRFETSKWSEEITFHKDYETRCLYTLINARTEYELTKYTKRTPSDVRIQDTYLDDKPVTRIAASAFYNSKIQKVTVGKNVKEIGQSAFQNCQKLETVSLPEGLQTIGMSAFNSCRALKSINIPSTIKKIEDFTFSYCPFLEEINLPNGLETIGAEAFIGCSSVETLTIPDSVTEIGDDAFALLKAMTAVNVGSGLEVISTNAFRGCESLKTVKFSDESSVKTIETLAFTETGLETITLPEGLETIEDKAFETSALLAAVDLPESLCVMGNKVFNETAIYDVQIEEGFVYVDKWLTQVNTGVKQLLTYLGKESGDPYYHLFQEGTVGIAAKTFMDSKSLIYIELPASVKYVGDYAFAGIDTLRRFYGNKGGLISIGEGAFSESTVNQVELANGLETIGSYAFYKTKIVNKTSGSIIPETVTSIGTYAFNDSTLWETAENNSVVYAGNWVVGFKGNISSVILSAKTKGISDYAFYKSSLTSISGIQNVQIIGRGAFYECAQLGMVTLSDRLTRIEDYAFYKSGIMQVNASQCFDLEYVGRSAFYRCNNLKELDLSNTKVSTIGDYAFYLCEYLENVTLPNNSSLEIGVGDYAFYKCGRLKKVVLPNNVVSIGTKCFYKCVELQSVTIGNGIKEIGDYMFSGCSALEMVSISDSVERIGNYAFYKASGLKILSIGANVKEIGNYAFYGAEQLSNLYIPHSVESIGKYAFKGCTELRSVTINSNVKQLGSHVFYGCKNATIYTDYTERPSGWNKRWNSSYRTVVWGCTLSDDGSYVTSVTITEKTLENVNTENGFLAPIRGGKDFKCWATAPTEAEAEKTYLASELVDVPVGTTLYAIWE